MKSILTPNAMPKPNEPGILLASKIREKIIWARDAAKSKHDGLQSYLYEQNIIITITKVPNVKIASLDSQSFTSK